MATIQKRNGKYRARIRRRNSQTLSKTFLSKSTAQAWVRKTESELERNAYLDTTEAENTSVSEILEKYQSEVVTGRKGAYRELSRIRLLNNSFGHLRLIELQTQHIAQFRNERLKVVQASTVRRDLSVLSSALTCAIKDWGITLPKGNPFASVRLPKVYNNRERRITEEEKQTIFKALKHSPLVQDAVRLALETGMRRGEITGIKPDDIDKRRRLLAIPISKNGSRRTIPLSNEALQILIRCKGRFDIKPDSITRACHAEVRQDHE